MVFGAESLPDRKEEGVTKGLGEVIEPDLGGVEPAAGTAAGDDGDVFFPTGGEEMALGADRVDGINDGVGIGGEELCGVFF